MQNPRLITKKSDAGLFRRTSNAPAFRLPQSEAQAIPAPAFTQSKAQVIPALTPAFTQSKAQVIPALTPAFTQSKAQVIPALTPAFTQSEAQVIPAPVPAFAAPSGVMATAQGRDVMPAPKRASGAFWRRASASGSRRLEEP